MSDFALLHLVGILGNILHDCPCHRQTSASVFDVKRAVCSKFTVYEHLYLPQHMVAITTYLQYKQ